MRLALALERLLHLAKQRNIGEGRLAKNRFALLDVAMREGLARRSDDGVTFFEF